LRDQKKKIVFTNGCFDILHAGHVKYLKKARQMGDVLMVGLNSDSSIKRLKGVQRPILPENDRAQILAGLSSVDYVVVFREPDPFKLIRKIRPNFLVKGGDYSSDNIVGAKFVRSCGGAVKTIPLVKNKSSNLIIDTILRRYNRH